MIKVLCFVLIIAGCFPSTLEVLGAVTRKPLSSGTNSDDDVSSTRITRHVLIRSRPSASSFFEVSGCTTDECVGNDVAVSASKWRMPLVSLGSKGYYLGIFFKANWYRAYQFCRYHGLHLVSIESQDENQRLEDYIKSEGLMGEHFWTSGTDQAEEGNFFWMGTGRPFTFTNWNAGEPNNFKYENGEEEHCLELWNRDGKGLRWNDTPCSFETYFVCERIEE